MNKLLQEKWPMVDGTQKMRDEMLDTLTDADLAFTPGGENLSLGALCRQMGEIEYSYAQSLKTFKQDWDYHNTEAGLDSSVARLKTWFQSLDEQFEANLAALSDEDMSRNIARTGFDMPVEWLLDVYLQALLIFFGKVTVYLKAMNKPLTEKFADWIW